MYYINLQLEVPSKICTDFFIWWVNKYDSLVIMQVSQCEFVIIVCCDMPETISKAGHLLIYYVYSYQHSMAIQMECYNKNVMRSNELSLNELCDEKHRNASVSWATNSAINGLSPFRHQITIWFIDGLELIGPIGPMKYKYFHTRKLIWKYRLPSSGHNCWA